MVDQGLHFTRRRHEGRDIYFVLNRGNKAVDGWVPLQTAGRSVAIFDALTGESGVVAVRTAAGGVTEVYLQLAPGQSAILKTFDGARGPSYDYYRRAGEPRTPREGWNIRFLKGGPELPPETAADEAAPWTARAGDAYKKFSGTALYTLSFKRPAGHGGDWLLDLGLVAHSARVRLNGRDLGTLITAPFAVRVPAALLREQNTLEVYVSNVALNRVIDMERRGLKYKRFYNTNFPARRPENRGADGLFDATKLSARESGLAGPVTLAPVEPLRF